MRNFAKNFSKKQATLPKFNNYITNWSHSAISLLSIIPQTSRCESLRPSRSSSDGSLKISNLTQLIPIFMYFRKRQQVNLLRRLEVNGRVSLKFSEQDLNKFFRKMLM